MGRFHKGDEVKDIHGARYKVIEEDNVNKTYKTLSRTGIIQEWNMGALDTYYWYEGLASNSDYPFPVYYSSDSEKLPEGIKICLHEWKNYVGLIKSYEFCDKCNEKRNIKP